MKMNVLVLCCCLTVIVNTVHCAVPKDCQPKRDAGIRCDSLQPSRMFYFDKVTKVCQPFLYNGCEGNSNKFPTAQECKQRCIEAAKKGAEQGECPGDLHPYMIVNSGGLKVKASCSPTHSCLQGYQCITSMCCPQKDIICSMPRAEGNFGTDKTKMTPRFYYYKEFNQCMLFTYYGHDGNANNFETYVECRDLCIS